MQPGKDLPSNYDHNSSLNLSRLSASILLNLAAVPLLVVFGWVFFRLMIILKGSEPIPGGIFSTSARFTAWNIAIFLFFIVFITVLHELVHGFFFWYFTRERPRFGLKRGYAFAAAPDWFFPRHHYIIIGLSPFLLIYLASLILAWISSPYAMPYFLVVAALNSAGSLGDLLVCAWVLRQPTGSLIVDEGDKFHAFAPSV